MENGFLASVHHMVDRAFGENRTLAQNSDLDAQRADEDVALRETPEQGRRAVDRQLDLHSFGQASLKGRILDRQ